MQATQSRFVAVAIVARYREDSGKSKGIARDWGRAMGGARAGRNCMGQCVVMYGTAF
mgnify:CR=1 FL=1